MEYLASHAVIQDCYNSPGSLDLIILQKRVSQLHLYIGRYISEEFAQVVFDTYNALSAALTKLYDQIYFPESPATHPEFISESMVDFCIASIEAALQELITTQYQRTRSQILSAFNDVVQSIYNLSFYVKYSLNHRQKKIRC